MHLNGFFRISWTVQLLVGMALFGISFLIESEVLQSFFAVPVIALALAMALEVGKAASIVWHRYLSHSGASGYTPVTRLLSGSFRMGLVGLSVLCSVLYLGLQLDRPNLEAVSTAQLAAVDSRLQQELGSLDADRAARIAADRERRKTEYTDLRRDHRRQVTELEALLRAEMDNTVGGVFKGPRYREIESRLAAAQSALDTALTALSERHRREAAELAANLDRQYRQARTALIAKAEAERRALRASGFDDDERTHHPRVVVFMRMAETVLGLHIGAPQFVFLFSLFLSLLMELGILLAFDTVTLAVIPALAAQHREEVMSEALMAEVSGQATRDGIRHRGAMNRVRKGAERVVERAHAHARAQSQAEPPPNPGPRRAA
jgi:hypothetical protein